MNKQNSLNVKEYLNFLNDKINKMFIAEDTGHDIGHLQRVANLALKNTRKRTKWLQPYCCWNCCFFARFTQNNANATRGYNSPKRKHTSC